MFPNKTSFNKEVLGKARKNCTLIILTYFCFKFKTKICSNEMCLDVSNRKNVPQYIQNVTYTK